MEKLFPLALLLATVLLSAIDSVNGLPGSARPTLDPIRTSLLDEIHHNFTVKHGYHLSQSNTDFARRLFSKINSQGTSKNHFFSPLSISEALAIVSLGTRSNTKEQLCKALGYTNTSIPQPLVHEAFKLLLELLTNERDSLVSMGCSMYVQDGFRLEKKFVHDAKSYYQADTFNVDFRATENAKQQINAYVRNKTHGKIEEIFKTINPDSVLVIVNYIFFKGSWLKPFDPRNTRTDDFYVDASTTVKVQMMSRIGSYYAKQERDLFSFVVLLPYKGNASMVLLLPDEGKMNALEENFSVSKFLSVVQSLTTGYIELQIPKFSLKVSYKLKDTLMKLGITDLFDSQADLSGISTSQPLKVTQIVHEAVLEVDEIGTVAAAATGAEMIPTAIFPRHKFNRPFFLIIVEHKTKSVLFTGKVMNPTESV